MESSFDKRSWNGALPVVDVTSLTEPLGAGQRRQGRIAADATLGREQAVLELERRLPLRFLAKHSIYYKDSHKLQIQCYQY
jgi:hypothetical protein